MISVIKLFICTNSRSLERSCKGSGSDKLFPLISDEFSKQGYDNIELIETSCFGKCSTGPILRIAGGPFFSNVHPEEIPDIVKTIVQYTRLKSP